MSEKLAGPEARYEAPYGEGPARVAFAGSDLLTDLEHPLPHRPAVPRAWHQYDNQALFDLQEMRSATPRALDELVSQPEALTTFTTLLGDLHSSLPFSPIERNWLCDTCFDDYDDRAVQEIELPWSNAESIRGGDLLRRWWAWRRDLDEFAEQDGVDAPKTALRGLVATFGWREPNLTRG